MPHAKSRRPCPVRSTPVYSPVRGKTWSDGWDRTSSPTSLNEEPKGARLETVGRAQPVRPLRYSTNARIAPFPTKCGSTTRLTRPIWDRCVVGSFFSRRYLAQQRCPRAPEWDTGTSESINQVTQPVSWTLRRRSFFVMRFECSRSRSQRLTVFGWLAGRLAEGTCRKEVLQ